MTISAKDWAMYVARLSRLGKTAESMMKEYIAEHGSEDIKDITEFAFGLVTKYGEGAASLACEMYEALAKAQGAKVPAASPAYTARFWETKVAMKGTTDAEKPAAVSRLVKRAGADTTMQNAIRDGAQFAWIPSGDSCPFCIALASRGWQYASKKSLKNGHAEHIHANCDCQYAIRFDKTSTVQGYDPEKYRDMYYSAEGSTPQEKINSMRRGQYANEKEQDLFGIPKSWVNIGEMSYQDVLRGTNPKFQNDLPEYLYGTRDDYTHNCTNCVVAYSQRRKGYNVTACSLGECGTLKSHNRFFTAWKGREPIGTTGNGLQEIIDYMKHLEDGSLVAISINMPESVFWNSYGHVFVAEKRTGKIIFLDPQRGVHYNNPEKIFSLVQPNETQFMRIDDLEISDRGVSACKVVP